MNSFSLLSFLLFKLDIKWSFLQGQFSLLQEDDGRNEGDKFVVHNKLISLQEIVLN